MSLTEFICCSISVLCLCELTCTVSLFHWCWELRFTMRYCLGIKKVGPLGSDILLTRDYPSACMQRLIVSKMLLSPLIEFVISPVIFFKRPVWFFCLFVCLTWLLFYVDSYCQTVVLSFTFLCSSAISIIWSFRRATQVLLYVAVYCIASWFVLLCVWKFFGCEPMLCLIESVRMPKP